MNEWIKMSPLGEDKEREERFKNRLEKEQEFKKNYTLSLSGIMGFNENDIEAPERWQPNKETQKEAYLINTADLKVKDIFENSIDEDGNIKNGSELFGDLFVKKISPVLGEEFAEYCRDNDYYIAWKEEEMLNDLCSFINTDNKSDIKKIEAIKFINDSIESLTNRHEGEPDIDSFVTASIINRIKNTNATVLERYFIRKLAYNIFNIGTNRVESTRFMDEKFTQKQKDYLVKEIGEEFDPEKYQNKFFNKFKFEFSKNQRDALLNGDYLYPKQEIKPLNYYKDKGIEIPHTYEMGFGSELYISSYIAPSIVGIYSRDGALIGWKEISNLKQNDVNSVNDFSNIKIGNYMNSSENKALFRISSSLGFRDFIQKELNVDLSRLNLENQFYFLNYIQGKTEEELERFKEFIKKSNTENNKNNKLKTFLSISYGGKEMGDKILVLGEKLPEEITKKVFAKYGEIINTADNTEEEIKKIFGDKDISERVLSSVKETLLKRGAKMLSDLGDKVSDSKFEVNETEILKELDEIKEEAIILGESFIGLYKEGIKVPIEDVTTTKETSTKDLTDERKEELMKIYEKGRPKVTYENKEHLDLLKNEFKQELEGENTSVFEICFNGETIIIALVDQKDKDTLYIGGLTFVDDVRNAVVAEVSMSYVLERFKNYNIKALVDSRNSILPMYLRRFGFEITKRLDSPEEMKENAGEIYYEIEKKKQLDTEKTISKEEFAEAA